MIFKFYAPEFGSPMHAREYCEGQRGKRDSNCKIRLVCGNAEDFERVACSLNFSQKYSSGIASWSKGDQPTEAQLNSFIDDFKNLAFAGLQLDRICWCVYLHSLGAKVDMHILIAAVDLKTKKHFNPAPPGSNKAYEALRDMYNARFGWCSPVDPRFERIVRPDFEKYEIISIGRNNIVQRKKSGVVSEGAFEAKVLRDVLQAKALAKKFKNRTEVLNEIEKWGEVVAVNTRSVDVKIQKSAEIVRLKGLLFKENFTSEMLFGLAPLPRPIRTKIDHDADKNETTERAAQMVLKLAIKRREQEHFDRYLRRAMRKSVKRKIEYDLQEDSVPNIVLSKNTSATTEFSKLLDSKEMRYQQHFETQLRPVLEFLSSSFAMTEKENGNPFSMRNLILENHQKLFNELILEKIENEKNMHFANNALAFLAGLSDQRNNARSISKRPR